MSETTSRSVEARFKAPQVCDWEKLRPTIARLYTEEGKPLKEVISILSRDLGFQATPRQYKQKISAWSLQKYYRPEDMDDLLRHYTKDELQAKVQNGHDSSLMVKGKRLSVSYVKRYLRRMKLLEARADSRTSPSNWSRSEDFTVASRGKLPPTPNVQPSNGEKPAILQDRPSSPCQTRVSTPPAPTPRVYRGSQESDSLDLRSASPSNISTEAFTTDKSSYEHDKDGSDTRRKRRKLSKANPAPSSDTRALACPFYKHDARRYNPQNEHMDSAMRYRTCAGPGWESISRLRQHLFRAHVASKRCRQCGSSLQSHSDLENHSLVCRADAATDMLSSSETMSEEQQRGLKLKPLPGLTKEQSWMRIYHILFPHDSNTPSPYYQSHHETLTDVAIADPTSGQLDALMEHLCTTLPQKILTGWQKYLKRQELSLPAELPSESAQRPPDKSTRAQRRPFAEKEVVVDPQSSATAQELKSVVSESVTETCTEWVRSHKAQDDDYDQELEIKNGQAHSISGLANLPGLSPDSMSTTAHNFGSNSEAETRSHLYSTSFADPGIMQWPPQQPFFSSEWMNPTDDFALCSLPNLSILDGDFNLAPGAAAAAAAATSAYDFSYLPVSPGMQFLDESTRADAAASGTLGGSTDGAFANLVWPVPPLLERDARLWPETHGPADTTVTMPPESNPDP